MRIRLNGAPRDLDAGTTIAALLHALDLTDRRLAVERNGEVVPRAVHGVAVLQDGDVVEVVRFVGGG